MEPKISNTLSLLLARYDKNGQQGLQREEIEGRRREFLADLGRAAGLNGEPPNQVVTRQEPPPDLIQAYCDSVETTGDPPQTLTELTAGRTGNKIHVIKEYSASDWRDVEVAEPPAQSLALLANAAVAIEKGYQQCDNARQALKQIAREAEQKGCDVWPLIAKLDQEEAYAKNREDLRQLACKANMKGLACGAILNKLEQDPSYTNQQFGADLSQLMKEKIAIGWHDGGLLAQLEQLPKLELTDMLTADDGTKSIRWQTWIDNNDAPRSTPQSPAQKKQTVRYLLAHGMSNFPSVYHRITQVEKSLRTYSDKVLTSPTPFNDEREEDIPGWVASATQFNLDHLVAEKLAQVTRLLRSL